jgi:hypothetical protein
VAGSAQVTGSDKGLVSSTVLHAGGKSLDASTRKGIPATPPHCTCIWPEAGAKAVNLGATGNKQVAGTTSRDCPLLF